jgi:uncharacterized protein YlxW (UPF0749 family)
MIPGAIKDLQKSVRIIISGSHDDVALALDTIQRVTGLEIAGAEDIQIQDRTNIKAQLRFVPESTASVEAGELLLK